MANTKISALTSATTPLAGTEVLPIVQSSTTKQVSVANLTAGRAVSMSTGATTGNFGVGIATPTMVTGYRVLHVDDQTAGASPGVHLTNDATTNGAGFGWTQFVGNAGGGGTTSLNFYSSMTGAPIHFWNENTNAFSIASQNFVVKTAAKGINFTANTAAAGMTSQLLNWYEEGTWTPNQGGGLTLVGAFSSTGTYTRIGRQVFIRGSVSGATSVAVASAGAISTNLPYSAAADATGSAINAANNVSSILRVSSATLTAATAIAATATITFSAVYSV